MDRADKVTCDNCELKLIFYEIDDEHLVPSYKQHRMYNAKTLLCWKDWFACAVGCGPVAWAILFGYLNRRSHAKPWLYGEGGQHLFTVGDDRWIVLHKAKAPKSLNENVVMFTERLHKELGTFYLAGLGSTPPGRMDRVDQFFRDNHKSGNPRIITHTNGFRSMMGNYSDAIRDKAIEYIKHKWPVVVGLRIDDKRHRMHYAVATGYQELHQLDDQCKLVVERYFYVHQGLGAHTGEWVAAKIFFAGVAIY